MAFPRTRRPAARLLLLALCALLPLALAPGGAAQTDKPTSVSIPGSFNSKIGCSADWAPDCDKAQLSYDATYDLWTGQWNLPAGHYEYKVAINKSWDENYGLHAAKGGANIPLQLDGPAMVKFYYDPKTHWVADSQTSIIATIPGSYQS